MQVLLFAILAVEIKRKAPTIHTFLEIIRCRWGTTAHIVFVVYGFLTNIIVTAMLILGGAAVMEALSGVSVYAASFLIPAGVVIYTAVGGLKGTVVAEWLNVCVIYIALLIFMFQVRWVGEHGIHRAAPTCAGKARCIQGLPVLVSTCCPSPYTSHPRDCLPVP